MPIDPLPRRQTRGRPKKGRDTFPFQARFDRDLLAYIQDVADTHQASRAGVLQSLLGEAHGYTSPWIRRIDLGCTADELAAIQRDVAAITPYDCGCVPKHNLQPAFFSVDLELANVVRRRCNDLDVAYSSYIHRTLLIATRFEERHHAQHRIPLSFARGERSA